ncbi:MAG: ATP-binding protein [Candidatus Odinarchaeota archaeon]
MIHLLVVSFSTLVIGFYIFSLNSKAWLHRSFLTICILVSCYSLIEFAMYSTTSVQEAAIWSKMLFFWPFILSTILIFTILFVEKGEWLITWRFWILSQGSSAFISFLHIVTDEASGVLVTSPFGWSYYIPLTPIGLFVSAWAYAYVLSGIYLTISFYRNTEYELKKKQAKWLAFGVITGGVLLTAAQVLVPLLEIPVPDTSSAIFLVLCVFIGYATWRYRFFEITPEHALNKIISTMRNLMILVDDNGIIKAANPITVRRLGYKDDELKKCSLNEVLIDPEISQSEISDKTFKACLKRCSEQSREVLFRSKNGGVFPVLLTVSQLKNMFDELVGFVCVGTDLTATKQMERELIERKELDRLQRQFISNASHELRTPITSLAQAKKIFEKHGGKITEQQQADLLAIISRSTDLLVALVDDLLVLSRLDSRSVQINWDTYDLSEVIHEAVNQLKSQFDNKDIILELDIEKNIQLQGDRKRICQIIRILLDNAVKYSGNGTKVQISARCHNEGEINPRWVEGVLLKVIDSGRGIQEQDIPHLFDRFFRSPEVYGIPGTGLGLSIAKELVELHNGELYVESTHGKGSSFSIFLPKLKQYSTNRTITGQ